MWRWLREFFCFHAWIKDSGAQWPCRPYYDDAACAKCGMLSMRGDRARRALETIRVRRQAIDAGVVEPGRLSIVANNQK